MSDRPVLSTAPRLVLGSSSKWRRQALADAGYAFEMDSPDVDELAIFEDLVREDCPTELIVIQIAEAKAEALLPRYAGQDAFIIAGDQLVEFLGEPRGKPRDADQAREWMRGYRGLEVSMVSALAVIRVRDGVVVSGTETSAASYGDLPDDAIELAIATGDVLRSCGAVTLEDPAVAPYAKLTRGTPDSVAGMPLLLLRDLLGDRISRFKA